MQERLIQDLDVFEFQSVALPNPYLIKAVLYLALLVLGALGLVRGPWLAVDPIATVGLILHTIATLWLLANVIKPLPGDRPARDAGMVHLVSAHVWFLMPVVVAR